MNKGWIKLWRKILDNPIFKDDGLFKCFAYCLLKANHKGKDFLIRDQMIHCEPGQFVTGRESASQELYWPGTRWRRKLDSLTRFKILSKQTTKMYTIVSIINWETYQGEFDGDDQVDDQDMTKTRPRHDQEAATNKNDKNVKNDKNKDIARSGKPKRALQMVDEEYIKALKENPAFKGIDVEREVAKLDAWLLTPRGRGKQRTQQRLFNWLCRVEKPMEVKKPEFKPTEGTVGMPEWINEASKKGWKV